MAPDPLGAAVRACPFLRSAAQAQGETYARNLAQNPFANASAGPVLLEDGLSSFAATLRLFHGPGGVVPLKRFGDGASGDGAGPRTVAGGCPFRAAAAAGSQLSDPAAAELLPSAHCSSSAFDAAAPSAAAAVAAAAGGTGVRQMARAPFASLSISGFGFVPDPSQLFNRPKPRPKQQRKPADPGSSRGGGSGGSGGSGSGSSSGSGSGRPSAVGVSQGASSGGGTSGAGTARLRPTSGGTGSGSTHHHHRHLNAGGGANPWGKVFGGLIPLAAGGHLQCPSAIVKMRAAVAALKPVRQLRPQALPIRALAMGGTAIAANLPCGAWREHTRKFSPQWFLAVHATIPFVAMLRKAVLMPKWAILLTLAGAIAGQNVGARMERERLRQLSTRCQPAVPAGAASSAVAAQHAQQQQEAAPAPDCVMPRLDAGCRRCLHAAQAAVAWTLAPTVVQ